jgi:predicted TIM-barrel fold metal-dependent hydrolase
VVRSWRRDIAELATCENVHVKLGGLAMPICGFEWHKKPVPPTSEVFAEVCAPYYEYCIEHFGANRCMFESNFPVDKVGVSYRTLWNTFKRVASGCSESEKSALFHDTAATFYRLI